jgi:beta-fructofuranosidase
MMLSINVTESSVAGLTVRKSPTTCEQTDIYIDVANEEISVDRSKSSLYYQFNNATDTGKFRLWHVGSTLQTLDLHIFVDNSIIEIYANGVFCLTTRIYPVGEDADGIEYLVKGGSAEYGEVTIWDGLDRAWPQRPIDSSVQLVYDTPQETDNYTYWTGN